MRHYSPRVVRCLRATLVSLFCSLPVPASVPPLAADDVGVLFDQSDSPGNIQQLIDDLTLFRDEKLQINAADLDALLLLPFLSVHDARAILQWRREHGLIEGPEDLARAVGDEMAARIDPFVGFGLAAAPRQPALPLEGRWDVRWFREYPERAGITEGVYLGGNDKLYSRLRIVYGDLDVRGVLQKDTGEPQWDDFTSLSVALSNRGIMKQLVAGNYVVSTGQGLLLGQGRYLSKGVDPLGVDLRGKVLKPYSSSAEYGFMQGAGVTLGSGPFDVTLFYSDNRIDASIDEGMITRQRISGYHRTERELLHKDNVREEVAGIHVRYPVATETVEGSAGMTWMRYRYSLPLEDAGGRPGWRDAGSVDFSLRLGSTVLFGEAALEPEQEAVSWITGVGFTLAEHVGAVLAVRDYHQAYFSPFAAAFAERASDAAGEEGYYAGIEARILKNLQVGAYYDIFRFPGLGSYYGLSSTGDEAKVFVSYRQTPDLRWHLLLQHQFKEQAKRYESEHDGEYYTAVPFVTDRIRLDMIAEPAGWLTWKLRGELKSVDGRYPSGNEHSRGWLVYSQANILTGGIRLKTRYSVFETDDYDSAVYVYEDDLPRVFSLPSYYGKGESFFAVLSWQAAPGLQLSGRFGTTWYHDRDHYSSGYDERPTSSPSSLHLGCLLTF
ncbi:helix-hairpin-helix domain-containing protein [Prosthecochloris sp. ZM_2]|uniref:helix-hairpin-helix domain-containing protein n=1 Tax=Prosthecochloris sp. ZM_2 TaxID=2045206 RepID=UPI001F47C87D|nr:helix-hairpin-helix domain-containing protein [Prosthecochloris sp. ZM_2]